MSELEFHPYANLFPLIEGKAFEELVADIKANGIRESIVMHEGKILDGRNRYRAGVAAGVITPDGKLVVLDGDAQPSRRWFQKVEGDPLAFVISANLHRRHLDETQRAMVATRLATLGHGGKRQMKAEPAEVKLPIGDLAAAPAAPPAMTQAAAAEAFNVSERSVARARVVVEQGAPELVAAADAGKVAVSVAAELAKLPVEEQREVLRSASPSALYRVIKDQRDALTAQKKVKRTEKVKALATKQRALPTKKYGVILADPEWEHLPWSEAGQNKAAANHYPVSSTAVIKARPVAEIAAPDCVLFMWTTVPHLALAFEVLAAWGFKYRSSAVWKKVYPGKQQGLGYWFRVNHEILLVATRGNVPAPAPGTQWGSVIEAPVGEHSEKPEAVHELIEAYFGDLTKIELNARKARPGWDVWGLEAPEAEAPPAKPSKGKKDKRYPWQIEAEARELRVASYMSALPDDLNTLIDIYATALRLHHEAVLASDDKAITMQAEQCRAVLLRANGGTNHGVDVNERPVTIRRACAAPLGDVPMWGQDGAFIVEHREVRAIIQMKGGMARDIAAVDLNRPFPSCTGSHSAGAKAEPGMSVLDYGRAMIDAAIAYNPGGKKGSTRPMVMPAAAYRLQLDERGYLVRRERGVWVDHNAPPFGLDIGLLDGLDVIRARWEEEDRAAYSGVKPKPKRTCPKSVHPNDKIIAVNGQMLTPVADFPTSGAYVVTAFKWGDDGKPVNGWRFVDEAAFHDSEPAPAPAEDNLEIPAFLRRDMPARDPDTADMFEGEGA